MQGNLILFLMINFSILFISGKELEFIRYQFRKKSIWGKAVNRLEQQCRRNKCDGVPDGLHKDICIRKCISEDCHQQLYAWDELEEGERDIRWSSFKGCASEELRKKNAPRMYDI